jgi:hypothetical protein
MGPCRYGTRTTLSTATHRRTDAQMSGGFAGRRKTLWGRSGVDIRTFTIGLIVVTTCIGRIHLKGKKGFRFLEWAGLEDVSEEKQQWTVDSGQWTGDRMG